MVEILLKEATFEDDALESEYKTLSWDEKKNLVSNELNLQRTDTQRILLHCIETIERGNKIHLKEEKITLLQNVLQKTGFSTKFQKYGKLLINEVFSHCVDQKRD